MVAAEGGQNPRKEFSRQLDRLETLIAELRVQFEQYFVDILPHPPEQQRKDVIRLIRTLLKAPFKNSADRFRLRTLVQRFQTYDTYWERVNKQREEGVYFRDQFKAEMREKFEEEDQSQKSQKNITDKGFKQLFNAYQEALGKTGASKANLNYDAFKNSLVKRAKQIQEKHGTKKLHYKISIKEGKVVVKVTGKK